jgi:FtsP/CotA-like multicopper oxidase with cupredoxin domain
MPRSLTSFATSRRDALRTIGAAALVPWASSLARASAQPGVAAANYMLRAATTRRTIAGAGYPDTPVWAYNTSVPGPVLRVRQGEHLAVTVVNDLAEDTSVHWHGLRIPNAMDGVPYVTQPPIAPRGGRFDYAFVPPDAGTFWYHPHARGHVQVEMGLHGALIVEEREPLEVDRDVLWVLDDWRLARDGDLVRNFDSMFDSTHAGRIGNTVTINGAVAEQFELVAGERIRLRLLNVANARIFALSFEGHAPYVIALDGMPCEPHVPESGRIVLGPGMRADVILEATRVPGSTFRVIDAFTPRTAYRVVTLAYRAGDRAKPSVARNRLRLPSNPVPEPDLERAQRHVITLTGGMMGGMMGGGGGMGGGMGGGRGGMSGGMGGMMGGAVWALNGQSATEGDHAHVPLLTLAQGRSHIIELRNDTAWWHPIHLHGHSFRIVMRNGRPLARRDLVDTTLLPPRETAQIALVADNPGDWMFHCHVLEHQATGMMATIRVA